MAQNDSSKSSKKIKQIKIPQRGLGVAQLEKIRLEETQTKNGVLQTGLQSAPHNNNPVLATDFLQNTAPKIDSYSVYKTIPGLDFLNKQLNIGQGGGSKLWNGEQILESGGFASRPKANINYDSIPILSSPSGIPMEELLQPQFSSSSMVKVSSGNSSSSSVITFNQMEQPSNQSFHSKIYTSISKWPEEEKVIGIKRAYPFSLDNLLSPAYPRKFPSVPVHVEPQKPLPREGPVSLNVMSDMRTEKVAERNGDFLTLAPPKQQLPHPTQELFEAGLNLQENVVVPNFCNFFPTSEALNGEAMNTIASCSGQVAEELDLNLKL